MKCMIMPLAITILKSFLLVRQAGNSTLLVLVLSVTLAFGQEEKPAEKPKENQGFVIDKILAKVDNYVVLRSELEGSYQNYLPDGNAPSEDAKCNLLGR